MGAVRTLSCVAFGALALAACSKSPSKAPGSAARASGAPSAATAQKDEMGPEIPAEKMPVIRAGLWETTEVSPGKQPRTDQDCENGKRKPMAMGKECQKLTLRRSLLGKYVIDAACDMGGGMAMSMHVEASGDFQTHWAADFTSRVKLPGRAEEVDTSHKEARYIGACPAGVQADDE
jgi:hypothetical protein